MGPSTIATNVTRSDLIVIAMILAGIFGVTYLHYSTAPGFVGLHAVYRYFYFLPIVYAALRFGYWGGLLSAMVASLLFAPHIIFKWGNFQEDSTNDLLVVVVFFCVAIITGVTVDRLRAAREAHRVTAQELAASLRKVEEQGEELRRAERLSALGSLAGGLAHQIRNPVGIIRASAQLLESDGKSETRETAAVIEEESDRIEHLIQDLLRYADGARPQVEPVSPYTLIGHVASRVQPMAEAQRIDLQSQCPDHLPRVLVDPRLMEQVLLNLAVNALQAVEADGTVTLRAEHSSTGRHVVNLFVADDGPGIATDALPHIYDPFYSTKDNGTGLGLSVVHRIIEDHGARIYVTSAPEIGTTFVICLAAAK